MYIIAIDGPAGTGKGSISKLVAEKLEFVLVKTGEMFRAITYKLIKEGIDLKNIEKVTETIHNINLKIEYVNGNQINILDGENINDKLIIKEVQDNVSQVSSIIEARNKVLEFEREIAKNENIVMEGRDIGTTVFPNADVKIYLIADIEQRVERRYNQLVKEGITNITKEEIKDNFLFRDKNDMSKKVGALKKADDALVVNNSNRTIDSTVNEIIDIVNKKIGDK